MEDYSCVLWLSCGRIFYQSTSSTRAKSHYQFSPERDITHSPKRWSNEETVIQYVEKIIILYIKSARASFSDDTPALVIMDNFKRQITQTVTELLESNNLEQKQW